MILNKDQEEAAQACVKFIQAPFNPEKPYFILTGGPGTGKTFMLNEVLNRIFSPDVVVATISHSAKNVIAEHMPNKTVKFVTIAQVLGMKQATDGTEGFVLPESSKFRFNFGQIFIIDEVSMMHDEFSEKVLEVVRKRYLKLIVVGDKRQLPPVGQLTDSFFFKDIDAELTISMRFKEPIKGLVDAVAKEIDNITNGKLFDVHVINSVTQRKNNFNEEERTGYKFAHDMEATINEVATLIKQAKFNISSTRMIAFKNETIDYLNTEVRKILTGLEEPPPYVKNELLISKKNYLYDRTPYLFNGKIVKVLELFPRLDSYGIPVISIRTDLNPNRYHPEFLVLDLSHPDTLDKYEEIREEKLQNALRDKKQWEYYYAFLGRYAEFDHAYAVNVYKAQGQTIDHVFVFEKEIMDVKPLDIKQKLQANYVALTRARKSLTIFNEIYR